jgi:hypothetical protein
MRREDKGWKALRCREGYVLVSLLLSLLVVLSITLGGVRLNLTSERERDEFATEPERYAATYFSDAIRAGGMPDVLRRRAFCEALSLRLTANALSESTVGVSDLYYRSLRDEGAWIEKNASRLVSAGYKTKDLLIFEAMWHDDDIGALAPVLRTQLRRGFGTPAVLVNEEGEEELRGLWALLRERLAGATDIPWTNMKW